MTDFELAERSGLSEYTFAVHFRRAKSHVCWSRSPCSAIQRQAALHIMLAPAHSATAVRLRRCCRHAVLLGSKWHVRLQLAWWTIWFQAAAILVAAVVQHQKWYTSRTMVMGLFCALTALMMVQTHFANNQRQVGPSKLPGLSPCVCLAFLLCIRCMCMCPSGTPVVAGSIYLYAPSQGHAAAHLLQLCSAGGCCVTRHTVLRLSM